VLSAGEVRVRRVSRTVDIELYRDFGETRITGQSLVTTPR
jgi:hypothetical protein